MKNNTLVIDIETDSLNIQNTKIFCIVGYNPDSKEFITFDCRNKDFIKDFFNVLGNYDKLVAHNGMKFDYQILSKYGKLPKLVDTLIDSKLMFPKYALIKSDISKNMPSNLLGSYSLKAFGYRLGNLKQEFTDFTQFTEEMLEYCKQDCIVCSELYNRLLSSPKYPLDEVRELEYKVAWLISKQEQFGFYFDINKAYIYQQELLSQIDELETKLKKIFPAKYYPISTNLTPKVKKLRGIKVVGAYTNIGIKEFNPNSRKEILERLPKYEIKHFTAKGNPVITPDTLPNTPYTKDLIHYLKLKKDYSQLYSGDKSIISFYNPKTNRIYGKVDSLGADTHRMTHNSPNFTQIPKTLEFRQSFTHPTNKCLIGIDADALEAMMLGYYLELFGNSEYIKIIATGSKSKGNDIHTKNQIAMKLATRDQAKTSFYALMYGIGGAKLSFRVSDTVPEITYTPKEYEVAKKLIHNKIVNGLFDRGDCFVKYDDLLILRQIHGNQIKQNFITNVKGFKELTENLKYQINKKGTITMLDKREISCRESHKALNYLLQGGGAIFMKHYLINVYSNLTKKYKLNKDYGFNSNIHDAITIETNINYANDICRILEQGFENVSNYFGFSYGIKGKAKIGNNLYEVFKD